MSLALLPRELLLIVAEFLPLRWLNSLVQVCRRLYGSLNSVLYYFALYSDKHRFWDRREVPPIFEATRVGNFAAVRRFICESGADVNQPLLHSSITLLYWAASFGHPSLVKLFLENGARILVDGKPRRSALKAAVIGGYIDSVKHILEYEPEPSDVVAAVCENSCRPGTTLIMPLLRAYILDKFQKDFLSTEGAETVMYRLLRDAIWTGDKDGVNALIDWGVPADIIPIPYDELCVQNICKDERSMSIGLDRTAINRGAMDISALFHAVLSGQLEVARLLYDRGALVEGQTSVPVLFAAAWAGNSAATELLMEWGVDVMVRAYYNGVTALHVAVGEDIFDARWPGFSGSVETIKWLISEGVPVDILDDTRASPLHSAIRKQWLAAVRLLLENGADVNLPVASKSSLDRGRETMTITTPIYLAAGIDSVEILSLLLEYGAKVSMAENDAQTPLMCVVKSVACAELLVELGCDMMARDLVGSMGLDYAVVDGTPELVQYFLNHGAPVDQFARHFQPLHAALQRPNSPDRMPIVKCLLDHGAPVNVRGGRHDVSPLWYAIQSGDSELVKLLLDNGADVHSYNRDDSDLHRAVFDVSKSLLPTILKYVVDINQISPRGETPLHSAVMRGQVSVLRMLVHRGASLDARNNLGETPLQLARRVGWGQGATYLESAQAAAMDLEALEPCAEEA